jgi:DNA-binding XRE family transcriptional regulator
MITKTRDMSNRSFRGLPKILKINEVDSKNLRLSVLFSNSEHRILDFKKILKDEWQVEPSEPEYMLLDPKEFKKVKLSNNTLAWDNVIMYMTGEDGNLMGTAFDVGADVLYKLSVPDQERSHSIGELFRRWRLEAKLTQDEVAVKSGTSRTYITKLENGTQDIELDTLFKIVEGGLDKRLKLIVE